MIEQIASVVGVLTGVTVIVAARDIRRRFVEYMDASKRSPESDVSVGQAVKHGSVTETEQPRERALEVAGNTVFGTTWLADCHLERVLSRLHGRVVYLARDKTTDQNLIVKMLERDPLEAIEATRRLFTEAQVLRHLDGNLAPRLRGAALDPATNRIFLVRDFLSGQTLTERLREAPRLPDPYNALRIAAEISSAAASLHSRGVVHRDLHPGNIVCRWSGESWSLQPPDAVAFIDFERSSSIEDTTAGDLPVGGAPGFMAPENYWMMRAGPAADVYSSAAIALMLLTGQSKLAQNRMAARLPTDLRGLIEAAMATDPHDRIRMSELARHLEHHASEAQIRPQIYRKHGLLKSWSLGEDFRSIVASITPTLTNDLKSIVDSFYLQQQPDDRLLIDRILRGAKPSDASTRGAEPKVSEERLRELHEQLTEIVRSHFRVQIREESEEVAIDEW